MTTRHRRGIQGAAFLDVVLGALVVLTPFATGDYTGDTSTAPLWSAVVAGALVIVLAGHNVYAASGRHTERAYGPAVANVLLGLWVLASPFLYGTGAAYRAAMVVLGVGLVAASGYNTWASRDARRRERRVHA